MNDESLQATNDVKDYYNTIFVKAKDYRILIATPLTAMNSEEKTAMKKSKVNDDDKSKSTDVDISAMSEEGRSQGEGTDNLNLVLLTPSFSS